MKPAPPDDDPLWLNSPWKMRLVRWGFYLLALLAALLLPAPLHWIGVLFIAAALRLAMPEWIGWVWDRLRALFWRERQGVHHSFAGEALDVHDDGHHMWLHERGLRLLLGLQSDPAEAFKARFSGHWREARELGLKGQGLWLKASAVQHHLAQAPERMDPRRVRLRLYIDREILQPAVRRHERRDARDGR